MADFMAAMWAKAPIMVPAIERRGIEFPRLAPDEVDPVTNIPDRPLRRNSRVRLIDQLQVRRPLPLRAEMTISRSSR